ncbi:MAG: tRNA uridine-5-carboxymethylaminomethyl(34) synthesis enzyme MnmG [Candidatus Omnitrophota bacterium]
MEFDIIVVGAGHAGCEAALSAGRMGFSVLILTMNLDTVGQMSCNPAVGGVAKGQLVREIDALGGMMGLWADQTGIQFHILNQGKGPAAFSPRAQSDKKAYQTLVRRTLENEQNLILRQGMAEEVLSKDGKVAGVRTREGITCQSKAVIIAPGTFLSAVLHLGPTIIPGGRMGEEPAQNLSQSLVKSGFEVRRFKTGTPPRVSFRSLNLNNLIVQPGDEKPVPFSFRTRDFAPKQISCYLTRTTPETIRIVNENLDRAPLYTGQIKGTGPRYCPSLEVKVKKFPDKTRHQIFLEPEGYVTDEVYVNGFSTSLPADVQEAALRTVPGLEDVQIIRFGYAVEYDFFPPHQIKPTMETKKVKGLYFAGQINGTSGYEEAAGQGLLAGINAGLSLQGKEPFVPGRDEAYLGVMASDLTTMTEISEPYRLFTSRAEYRLLLRSDNADFRLMDYGYQFGLISKDIYEKMCQQRQAIAKEIERLNKTFVSLPNENVSLAKYLRRPEVSYQDLEKLTPTKCRGRIYPTRGLDKSSPYNKDMYFRRVKESVEIEIKYEGYLAQDRSLAEKMNRDFKTRIPERFDYDKIPGLSAEGREKLKKFRPTSLEEARRIDGLRASDLTLLFLRLH